MTAERRTLIWIGALVVFGLLLYVLRDILMPFVAGMAVAYFLDPLADRLEKWGCSRTLATSLILAAFIIVLVAIIGLLFPLLHAQVVGFVQRLPTYLDALRNLIVPLITKVLAKLTPEQISQVRAAAGTQAGTAIQWVVNLVKNLLGSGVALFNLFSLLFITPLVTFYLLRDWDRIGERLDSWLPRAAAPTIRGQMAEIDRTIAGFVRGQATVCLILAAVYGIGLTLVGLDFGLLVGLGTGLIAFIPFIGAMTGFVTALGIAFAQFDGWVPIALVCVVFGIGQVLEGQVLTPRLVGQRVGLHPVWVVFALLVGGSLFGFTGVLLAVPAAAVIGVLVRFAHRRYMQSTLYHGSDEPPPGKPADGGAEDDGG